MKYEVSDIEEYIQPVHPILIKSYLWTWFFMLNLIGLPTAFLGKVNLVEKIIILPMIIFLNILIFIILTDREKWQKLYVLYVGLFSLCMSIILIISSIRIYELNPNSNTILLTSITSGIYIVILIVGFKFHISALKKGHYAQKKKGKQKKKGRFRSLMKVAPVLGIMIGSIALRYLKGRQDIVVIITVILILTLAYAIELGMHNIYKYKLMKDYADYVRTFKLPVKEHKNKPV